VSRALQTAIVAALEALEAGDVAEATRVLLDAVQEPVAGPQRFACPTCGLAFQWPGELEAHLFASGHGRTRMRTRAA
jgi:hypothetical protein